MGDRTGIQWTNATWNPIRGCTRVSPGCGGPSNVGGCYAERIAARFAQRGMPFEGFAKLTRSGPRWTGRVELVEEHLQDPIRWQKPRRVFVNSMSDLFHEKLADSDIERVFAVMLAAPRHQYQVLTKRPARMKEFVRGWIERARWPQTRARVARKVPPFIWLGGSVEDQPRGVERIPLLQETPAAVRFLSVEPLIGPVDLSGLLEGISWVIVGAESGPHARPTDLDWVRHIRDQCVSHRVAFFLKQLRVKNQIVGLPELDGRRWQEYPDVGRDCDESRGLDQPLAFVDQRHR